VIWGKPMTMPEPWTLGVATCGAARQSGPGGSFRSCDHRPTHAGVKLHRSPIRRQLECWLMFACTQHVDQIDAARSLLPRDETVRQAWQEQHRRAMAGHRFEAPQPLATGADAKTLYQRAQAWAARRATGDSAW
jgi:hypothetical protein